ncbi:MAG: hypothetical protein FWF90_05245 [Promicromonosporaceae bacterium]|nr:hypothetical protein [Promicromonosporaceae bacterium]
MPTVRFSVVSRLGVPELMKVLTDFSPSRVDTWPSIDAEHFRVHGLGPDWAEVTEGTAAAWERARYEWDDAAGRVVITTHDSKVAGPGGWVFQLVPLEDGDTRVEVELERRPTTFKQRIFASVLPLSGGAFAKSFASPLQTR